jgi:hypothetical protein
MLRTQYADASVQHRPMLGFGRLQPTQIGQARTKGPCLRPGKGLAHSMTPELQADTDPAARRHRHRSGILSATERNMMSIETPSGCEKWHFVACSLGPYGRIHGMELSNGRKTHDCLARR